MGSVGEDPIHYWNFNMRIRPSYRSNKEARNLAFREAWATLFGVATQYGDSGYPYVGDSKYQDVDEITRKAIVVDLEGDTSAHKAPGEYYEHMNCCVSVGYLRRHLRFLGQRGHTQRSPTRSDLDHCDRLQTRRHPGLLERLVHAIRGHQGIQSHLLGSRHVVQSPCVHTHDRGPSRRAISVHSRGRPAAHPGASYPPSAANSPYGCQGRGHRQ